MGSECRWDAISKLLKQWQKLHGKTNFQCAFKRFCSLRVPLKSIEPDAVLSYHCSYYHVFCYVRWILQKTVPRKLWGNDKNFQHILKQVERFIKLRRYESLSIDEVISGFKHSCCDWLISTAPNNHARQLELLCEFLKWLFNDLIINILKNTFYITESTPYRHRVFYFRRDVWNKAARHTIKKLGTETFRPIGQGELAGLLSTKDFGCFKMRFLPKESGLRPIVNLNKKYKYPPRSRDKMTGRSCTSTNQTLQGALAVLNSLKNQDPDFLGSAVLGIKDIHERLKAFKQCLRQTSHSEPLYFAKIDINKAYDTISQDKLLQIMDTLINSEEYMSFKYAAVYVNDGKAKKLLNRDVVSIDHFPQFPARAKEISSQMKNALIVDQVQYSYQKGEEISSAVKDHLKRHFVEIGNKLYQQTVGIPQGSILSVMMCSLFYSDMEKQNLMPYISDGNSIMLRFLDDFLFITTKKEKAARFLRLMFKGHEEYGCFVNQDKSLCNFEATIGQNKVPSIPSLELFPWCGVLINPVSLDISSDISRYYGSHIGDSITVDHGYSAGERALHKIIFFLKPKCRALFLDTDLNSRESVMVNIWEIFMIAAMKFHVYMRGMPDKKLNRQMFYLRVIDNVILSACRLFRARALTNHGTKGSFKIDRQIIIWLALDAFKYVLGQKSGHYPIVLYRITVYMNRRHRLHISKEQHRKFLNGLRRLSEKLKGRKHVDKILF